MQKSTWLWAFLPYPHWFGPVVNGAVVLTPPANLTHLVRPSRLDNIPLTEFAVIDKERGPVLPAVELFQAGIVLMADGLAPEDFDGFISNSAWQIGTFIFGVHVGEQQGKMQKGQAQIGVVLNGLYIIFLMMKQEKDFRSGIFEVQFSGYSLCDMVIYSTASSGLHLAPSFAHVTQLRSPPSSVADNTTNPLQRDPPRGMDIYTEVIIPWLIHQMDKLGQLINIVDMLREISRPPANKRVHRNYESSLPSSGVKLSLNLTQYRDLTLTYADLIWAVGEMAAGSEPHGYPGQALKGEMFLYEVYQGVLTLLPSTSSPSTSPLVEVPINASSGTATAKKRSR